MMKLDAGEETLQNTKKNKADGSKGSKRREGLAKATTKVDHLKEALKRDKEKYTLERALVVDIQAQVTSEMTLLNVKL